MGLLISWEDIIANFPKSRLGEKLLDQWGKKQWENLERDLAPFHFLQARKVFPKDYRLALWYLVLREAQTYNALHDFSLMKLYHAIGINSVTIYHWLGGRTRPRLLKSLLVLKEARRRREAQLLLEARDSYFGPEYAYEFFKSFRNKKVRNSKRLAIAIESFYQAIYNAQRIVYVDFRPFHRNEPAWLSEVACTINVHRLEIEQLLNQRLGLEEISDLALRIGVINNKLYLWLRDTSSDNWLNIYGDEYFHFKVAHQKNQLANKARRYLSLNTQLGRLVGQITHYYRKRHGNNSFIVSDFRSSRTGLIGETLHFLLDATNQTLSNIQHQLHDIGVGARGRGRILNPLFPTIEPLRTKLFATMISDGTLKPNDALLYYEENPTRRQRVKALLQQLGDVQITEIQIPSAGLLIPAVVGRLIQRWGMPKGDRTILNIGLPSYIIDGSDEVKTAYLEQLIPEEGSFGVRFDSGVFSWSRSVALQARKSDSKISEDIIDLIRNFGRCERVVQRHYQYTRFKLVWSRVKRISKSDNKEESVPARFLQCCVVDNPSHLLDGEIKLCESLGIKIKKQPGRVTLYEKSGRVSVDWRARTATFEDAIRWALIAPPDDLRKRELVRKYIESHPEKVKPVVKQLLREKQVIKFKVISRG